MVQAGPDQREASGAPDFSCYREFDSHESPEASGVLYCYSVFLAIQPDGQGNTGKAATCIHDWSDCFSMSCSIPSQPRTAFRPRNLRLSYS